MRMLFFSTSFPSPWAPTLAPFNLRLMQALAERHQVQVVCPVAWTAKAHRLLDTARAGGRRVPSGRTPVLLGPGLSVRYPTFWYLPGIARDFLDVALAATAGRVLAEEIDRFRPAAVLSYWAHPDATVAVRLAHRSQRPAVVFAGGSDVLLRARDAGRRRRIEATLRAADAVVAVSENILDVLRSWRLPAERLHLIPRGVDKQIFHKGSQTEARRRLGLPADGRITVSVGRLEPVKGLATLIEAADLLRKQGRRVDCYILGEGSQRRTLEAQIAARGLGDRVRLMGGRAPDELADWYRAADATVLPSLSEGIPNVLLESLACGTPFVASDVGGVPEIADPLHHRLVPAGNAGALAEGMIDLLLSPRLAVPPRFEPISWTESAERVERVVARFVHGAAAQTRTGNSSHTAHPGPDPRTGEAPQLVSADIQ